jgi:hypothetical protein
MAMLYWGSDNNGVHTLLTQEAVNALNQRDELARANGNTEGTEALVRVAARGTFAFVDEYSFKYYRGYVTGTLQELNIWADGLDFPECPHTNYVPFSNGGYEEEPKDYIRTPGEVITALGLKKPVSPIFHAHA